MIKESFLKSQINKAKKERKTPSFVKRLVLLSLDDALAAHYSNERSMKCLQSSLALVALLEKFNIKATIWSGAVCVSKIPDNSAFPASWNGFWGDDHHVFCCTEFGELIDLTISYLHEHPNSKHQKQLPVPAIWWGDIESWPCIIRYLPEGPVKVLLPEVDMIDLELFKSEALANLQNLISTMAVQNVKYGPILTGKNSLNILTNEGNQWLNKSLIFQHQNIPFPEWVSNKESELMREHAK